MKHVVFKVKEGKQDDWRSWCQVLCERQTEAEETMKEENCVYERSVMFERDGNYYMVGTVGFSGEPKKANLDVALNVQHQKSKGDCLGNAIATFEGDFQLPPLCEVLYEFDLRNEYETGL